MLPPEQDERNSSLYCYYGTTPRAPLFALESVREKEKRLGQWGEWAVTRVILSREGIK